MMSLAAAQRPRRAARGNLRILGKSSGHPSKLSLPMQLAGARWKKFSRSWMTPRMWWWRRSITSHRRICVALTVGVAQTGGMLCGAQPRSAAADIRAAAPLGLQTRISGDQPCWTNLRGSLWKLAWSAVISGAGRAAGWRYLARTCSPVEGCQHGIANCSLALRHGSRYVRGLGSLRRIGT